MRLNIGCGYARLVGYKGVDINPEVGADYCCSAWELPIEADSVDEVYARHFLEHVTPVQARMSLKEWRRVLKKSGLIHLILPDLEFHCRQLLTPGTSKFVAFSNFDHAMAGLYGWINMEEPNAFMEHKWGYTKSSLSLLAKGLGFNTRFAPCRECDIDATLTPDS